MFIFGYLGVGGTAHDAGQLFGSPALAGLTLALVLLCTVVNFFIMNAWQRCVSATESRTHLLHRTGHRHGPFLLFAWMDLAFRRHHLLQ